MQDRQPLATHPSRSALREIGGVDPDAGAHHRESCEPGSRPVGCDVRHDGVVVPFRETGTRPPIFVVAGLGGGVMIFRQLAEMLGDDRPVYGLQGIGLDGKELPLDRIDAIAGRYLDEIKRIQPAGPYYLVGWSMGGVITYELALQILDAGDELGVLVIVDEFAPVDVPAWERLGWHVARFRQRSLRDKIGYITRSISHRFDTWRRCWGYHPPIEGLKGRTAELVKDNALAQFRAVRNYRPRTFPGDVAVIRADHSLDIAHPRADDPQMGWGQLVRGRILARTVPGSHGGIFNGPNVHVLKAAVQECIEQLDRPGGASRPTGESHHLP
jgi:thioesterase domain-containing protein